MSTTNSTAAKVPTVAISMCALARRIAATNRVPLEVAQRMTEGIRARARAEGGRKADTELVEELARVRGIPLADAARSVERVLGQDAPLPTFNGGRLMMGHARRLTQTLVNRGFPLDIAQCKVDRWLERRSRP